MKEEWLLHGAVVPVDVETTAALVAEIKRLIDVVGGMALKEPALQGSEQYRMQMAAICTAAIGYWTEHDSISQDYDTVALRDVAKLYAKYDALYKAQDMSHGMIAGALFDFMAWLTSRPKRIMLSSVDDASPAVDAIKDFAKMRGLSLDNAQVQTWQEALAQPDPYKQGYADAMNWKVQNHLEHLPAAQPERDYERGFIDGMQKQMQSSVDKAVNAMSQRTWVALTDEEVMEIAFNFDVPSLVIRTAEHKLKEKNAP